MDEKMINLAIGKLADDMEKLKAEIKEILIELKALKQSKTDTIVPKPAIKYDNEFLTLKEVREVLKMSRNSIIKLVEDGLIRPIRFSGRTIRYSKEEILSLLEAK
ncbi:MAG: helix-turn-helix transcriptional regulator [Bacteroidota bacterium]